MEKHRPNPTFAPTPRQNWKRIALLATLLAILLATALWNRRSKSENIRKAEPTKPSDDWRESYIRQEACFNSPRRFTEFTDNDWLNLLQYYAATRLHIQPFDTNLLKDVAALKELAIENVPEKERFNDYPQKLTHYILFEVACRLEPSTHKDLKKLLASKDINIVETRFKTCICLDGLRPVCSVESVCANKFITDEEVIEIAKKKRFYSLTALLYSFIYKRPSVFSAFLPKIAYEDWPDVLRSLSAHYSMVPIDTRMINEATEYMIQRKNIEEILILSTSKFEPLIYLHNCAKNDELFDAEKYGEMFRNFQEKETAIAFGQIVHQGLLRKYHPKSKHLI